MVFESFLEIDELCEKLGAYFSKRTSIFSAPPETSPSPSTAGRTIPMSRYICAGNFPPDFGVSRQDF